MKLLRLTQRVFEEYKTFVKGNSNLTYKEVQEKLTRNVTVCNKKIRTSKERVVYFYGNLKIVVKGDLIVRVKNYKDKNFRLDIKRNMYEELNKELGIAQ